jgi:hypothetical protein
LQVVVEQLAVVAEQVDSCIPLHNHFLMQLFIPAQWVAVAQHKLAALIQL